MKNKIILASFALLAVAACGPGEQGSITQQPRAEASKPVETSMEYDSVGVISAVNGGILTLDHEGASAAGLAAGRDDFIAYADVLAEAPITPGARVAFRFHRTGEGLELTALKGR